MSILLRDSPTPEGISGDNAFDTSLIARLLNDAFHGREIGEVIAPTALSSSGPSVAGIPSGVSSPAQASPAEVSEIALPGGFPSTLEPGPPPVHPSVVAADPLPADQSENIPDSETYPDLEENGSYPFGEPRSYLGEQFRVPAKTPQPAPSAAEDAELPYFLRGLPGAVTPGFSEGLEAHGARPSAGFDIDLIRSQFPALNQRVNGRPLIWLDNAATTHKPQAVIDATSRFYGRDNSNIHRAAHTLAQRSTELFEGGREKVRQFLGAADAKEIIFVRGTTEGINLIAQTYGSSHVGEGDEILLSQLEHHANIVPWQMLAQRTGAVLRVIPINDRGELILEEVPRLITPKTKLVSITHVSNALGTVNPVEEIISIAHGFGIPVVVDGAQSTPHMPVNVQALNADFYVFSGHKVFGPTGIGAVYGKAAILESLPPWQGGGHMIRDVTFERTVYQNAPERFEAGTPDIAGVVGLGAAIDFITRIGIPAIAAYEHALLEYATAALATVPGIRPIGTATNKASVLGFVIPGISNETVAKHLDQHGVAVRAGHHCAMPAVRHFGVESTVRPSLAFYNTIEEVDTLVRLLKGLSKRTR